jgi:hypothetical protein
MSAIKNQNFYSTSKVMYKFFSNEKLDINDRINFKTIYREPNYGFKRLVEHLKEIGQIK